MHELDVDIDMDSHFSRFSQKLTKSRRRRARTRVGMGIVGVVVVAGAVFSVVELQRDTGEVAVSAEDTTARHELLPSEIGSTTTVPSDPQNSGESVAEESFRLANGIVNINGVEVVLGEAVAGVPSGELEVAFDAMVVENDDGSTRMCIGPTDTGGVGCDGFDISGFSFSSEAAPSGGQLPEWRLVVTSWPPVDGRVRYLRDQDTGEPLNRYPASHDGCHVPRSHGDAEVLNAYGKSLETFGGVWVSNQGQTLVFQATDDPGIHTEALSERGLAAACVVQVENTLEEQLAAQDEIAGAVDQSGNPIGNNSKPGPYGRLDVTVPVADLPTVNSIAAAVSNPETIRVVGEGTVIG